jgi:ribosomal protein S18 acetylase RimI-like enzyme
MEILFSTEQSIRLADEIVDYLRGPRLWIPKVNYPDFDAWTEKVHAQIKNEAKRAILALSFGELVGAVIYQRHKEEPEALELKNITVRPDLRGRYVASFLLRNAEIEGCQDYGVSRVLVDAKADNYGIRALFLQSGYKTVEAMDLYGLGAGTDIIYSKSITQH